MRSIPAAATAKKKPSSIERIQRLEKLEQERLEEKERKDERRRQAIAGAKPSGGRHDLVDRIERVTKFPMALLGVVWLVLDSYLEFIEDKREWNGTSATFDIARKGDNTEVRFTHAGLVPAHECYGACSSAWSSYIRGSLRSLIATGKGQPNLEEKTRKNVRGAAAAGA